MLFHVLQFGRQANEEGYSPPPPRATLLLNVLVFLGIKNDLGVDVK